MRVRVDSGMPAWRATPEPCGHYTADHKILDQDQVIDGDNLGKGKGQDFSGSPDVGREWTPGDQRKSLQDGH